MESDQAYNASIICMFCGYNLMGRVSFGISWSVCGLIGQEKHYLSACEPQIVKSIGSLAPTDMKQNLKFRSLLRQVE